jgi:threonine/homoserine/homoserine lactone efflux protein
MSPVTHDLLVLALAGFAAGLAIAMPLGAIGVLILRESMVRGLGTGLAAGAGTATVDFLYCGLAVALGATIADAVQPWLPSLALVSGVVIVGIGVYQLVAAVRAHRVAEPAPEVIAGGRLRVYGRFVALTALNPATIVYFIALSAVVTTVTTSVAGPVVFVAATFLASLLWQSALAVVGAAIGAAVTERTTRTLGIVASCAIIALGIVAIVAAAARM